MCMTQCDTSLIHLLTLKHFIEKQIKARQGCRALENMSNLLYMPGLKYLQVQIATLKAQSYTCLLIYPFIANGLTPR